MRASETTDSGSSRGPGSAILKVCRWLWLVAGEDCKERRDGLGATDDELCAEAGVSENICGNEVLTRCIEDIRESDLRGRDAGEESRPVCARRAGEPELDVMLRCSGSSRRE